MFAISKQLVDYYVNIGLINPRAFQRTNAVNSVCLSTSDEFFIDCCAKCGEAMRDTFPKNVEYTPALIAENAQTAIEFTARTWTHKGWSIGVDFTGYSPIMLHTYIQLCYADFLHKPFRVAGNERKRLFSIAKSEGHMPTDVESALDRVLFELPAKKAEDITDDEIRSALLVVDKPDFSCLLPSRGWF